MEEEVSSRRCGRLIIQSGGFNLARERLCCDAAGGAGDGRPDGGAAGSFVGFMGRSPPRVSLVSFRTRVGGLLIERTGSTGMKQDRTVYETK